MLKYYARFRANEINSDFIMQTRQKDFKDPARDKDEEILTGGNDFMQNWRENDFMQNHANTI